jgi:PAS domain S-box-containing protein
MGGNRRQIFAPVALLVLLALLTGYMAVSHAMSSRESQKWVTHTYLVLDAVQRSFVSVQDAENAQRSYLLTNDPSFAAPFNTNVDTAHARLEELTKLVKDNTAQVERVDALKEAVDTRFDTLRRTIAMARDGQRDAAIDIVINGSNRTQMATAREFARQIGAEERRLLVDRNAKANSEELRGFVIAGALSLLVLIALAGAVVVLVHANRQLADEIARRKAAEQSEKVAAELIQTVFNNTPEYLILIDVMDNATFRIADINPAFEAVTGLKARRVRGHEVREVFKGDGENAHAAYTRLLAENRSMTVTEQIVGVGPQPLTWETRLAPVHDAEGRIVRIVASSRDVTERDALESQLRRAQRMEAVGQLTGGVAHDFNNLLQVIRANLEMIGPALANDPTAHKRLRNAIHGADRAAQLTRQMLAFARRQPLEPKVVNLGRLVGDMAEMMRRTIGEAVEVETVIAGGLWNTIADPAQVESAVLNLAINARDAMPGGGKLTIELANTSLDDVYALRDQEIMAGQYVMLAVSDTGEGMPPETVARVFEPFFTTKADGKGTGLGLSMVYGFVKQSSGHVQIYSEPGSGTTVKIYLPRSRKAEENAVEAPIMGSIGQDQVILVVEDEEAVRAAAFAMLEEMGYRCLQASSAQAALDIVQSGEAIDLLFTDVVMPGPLKTRDFVAQTEALRPGMPVLYTSGYTENAIVHHGRLDEGVSLLSKPYSRNDLARKVAALMNTTRPTVLVVEDDSLVRTAAVDMITELGFIVVAVEDAPAALAHLESGLRIDVLFTDVGLPGMRGPALAAAARNIRPDIKVVFASGYGETEETGAVHGALHLAKPYQRQSLAKLLKSLG